LPVRESLSLAKVGRGIGLFGYDQTSKQTFYGVRAHLRVCWPGVIVSVELAPANVHELRMAEELL
jgi:hypothetical protein